MQWCVAFHTAWSPTPSVRVTDVAPANNVAWTSDPSFAESFQEIRGGPWACAAIQRYFKMPARPLSQLRPNALLPQPCFPRPVSAFSGETPVPVGVRSVSRQAQALRVPWLP
jgi:hypothetical protein